MPALSRPHLARCLSGRTRIMGLRLFPNPALWCESSRFVGGCAQAEPSVPSEPKKRLLLNIRAPSNFLILRSLHGDARRSMIDPGHAGCRVDALHRVTVGPAMRPSLLGMLHRYVWHHWAVKRGKRAASSAPVTCLFPASSIARKQRIILRRNNARRVASNFSGTHTFADEQSRS